MRSRESFYEKLEAKSRRLRKTLFQTCVKAGTGHVTSSCSCIEILVALFHGDILNYDPANPKWEKRDRFILSKGQASPAFYAVLADCGFFGRQNLGGFAQANGKFGVHLQMSVPGAEITAGSLGHGFGIAAGIALGAKLNRELFMTYALLGDGECYEGSIWETAMFAGHNRLNNLVAIVDRNALCVTDFTENIVALEPFEDKWESFGWDAVRVDGHDFSQLVPVLEEARARKSTRPLAVIADTVKGKGIKSLCYQPLWHGLVPKGRDEKTARTCLEKECGNE